MEEDSDRDPKAGESPLDPSADAIRAMGAATLEWVADYYRRQRTLPVYPKTSAAELKALLEESLPQEGRAYQQLLATFRDVIAPNTRHNGHPRFFGYVSAPGSAVAAMADLLASALNPNVTAWRSAPSPAQLERLTIDWIKEAVGFPATAGGLLMSGGSMATLTALAAARHRATGDAANTEGLQAYPRHLRLYASEERHHSVDKAAALLGIGRANVRIVPVDPAFRMVPAALDEAIAADIAAGLQPFAVVATAGTVVTGAIDPLPAIAAIARRRALWLHVDGCYGGFARLAPGVRDRLAGLEEADSIALDPHKWLYLPADCGCLLYRDAEAVRPAFTLDADYTRVMVDDPDEAFAYWEYGPDLSRRFRALKVWMLLAHVGARELGAAIDANIDCARHLADLVAASDDFEMMAPVGLSIFCFRHVPAFSRGISRTQAAERELDAYNERLLGAVQRAGSSYLSNASIRGRFALRGCVLNYRTSRRDMAILLDDVRAASRSLAG
jgi:aromatic-L-amino-acid decarboxylase